MGTAWGPGGGGGSQMLERGQMDWKGSERVLGGLARLGSPKADPTHSRTTVH